MIPGTQEEAAAAYDLAAIEYRGLNAVTNFDISHYIKDQLTPPLPQPTAEEPQAPANFLQEKEEEEGPIPVPVPTIQKPSHNHHQRQQQHQHFGLSEDQVATTRLPTPDLHDSIDQSTMMDPMDAYHHAHHHHHHHHHTWNICMDSVLSAPDFALERSSELPPLFKDDVFEDNIEYLFEGGLGGSMVGKDEEEETLIDMNGIFGNSGRS